MSQIVIDLKSKVDLSSQNYMVSKSNEEAYHWVNQWPDWPGHCLIIYGPESSGKSHLINIWSDLASAKSINDPSLAEKKVNIAIDDFDSGKFDEEFLLHTYNYTKENGAFLLLASIIHPKKMEIKLADLRSRLLSCPAIPINPPDDELLRFILVKYFSDRQLRVSNEVTNYILHRIERSSSSVKKVVERLDKLSLVKKRNITIPLVKEAMENL